MTSFREPALENREMSWEGFGWPRWNLAAPLLPIAALWAAITERDWHATAYDLLATLTWDQTEITGEPGAPTRWWPEILTGGPSFLGGYGGTLSAVDRYLARTCVHYLDDREGGEATAMPFWTFGALLEAACEATGDAEPVMPDPSLVRDEEGSPRWPRRMLTPEWPYRWLLQRKAAVGLLRRFLVPALCGSDELDGSVHTGIPLSPQEAFEAAVGNSGSPSAHENRTHLRSTVTLIYGPDHGWREGSYCCDLLYVVRLRPPKGWEGDFWLEASPPDGDPEHFDGFGVLQPGWNLLDGETGFPAVASLTLPTPAADRQEMRGWQAAAWMGRDGAGAFHFT